MIIRPVEAGDRAAWTALWRAYLAFYETELAPENYEAGFARLLSPGADQFCGLIAEVDGQPQGLAHYLIHRDIWSLQDKCYLGDLFVTPEARGQGLARALIEAVSDAARTRGCHTLYWETQHSNTRARALYDKLAEEQPFVQYMKTL